MFEQTPGENGDPAELLAHYHYDDGGQLFGLETGGGLQYAQLDTRGSTTLLTNASGAIVTRYAVDPWGRIAKQSGASVNRQVFTGHQHDAATGLVYGKARYYDPSLGAFLSRDSWEGEQDNPYSLHKYAYAYGNPLGFTDPTGHFPLTQESREWFASRRQLNDDAATWIRAQDKQGIADGGEGLSNQVGRWIARLGSNVDSAGEFIFGTIDHGLNSIALNTGVDAVFSEDTRADMRAYYENDVKTSVAVIDGVESFASKTAVYVTEEDLAGRLAHDVKRAAGRAYDGTVTAFTDVRSEENENAGVFFIDMLLGTAATKDVDLGAVAKRARDLGKRGLEATKDGLAELALAPLGAGGLGGGNGGLVRKAWKARRAAEAVESVIPDNLADDIARSASDVRGIAGTGRSRREIVEDFQDHHIISDKNPLTRDHELLTEAGFDLQARANKIYLPEQASAHATRSIHRGRHRVSVSRSLANRMDAILEAGRELGWSQPDYRRALDSLLREERGLLLRGERALNRNKRPWAR